MAIHTVGFLPSLLACALLAACAGGGGTPSVSTLQLSQPATAPKNATTPVDDWPTYAHDNLRTAYQTQQTGISASTVSSLALRWTYHDADNAAFSASPIVTGGTVYVADSSTQGVVLALDARTGSLLWQTPLGGPVKGTPTFADGMLFVGTHSSPSTLAALNAKTGAIVWQTTLPGPIRSEPIVANGMVYEGDAGGDPPLCNHGGLHAFNEMTGTLAWNWYPSPQAGNGGSVWSPITFDGQNLYFGTGNTCTVNLNTADAFVKLTTAGSLVWSFSPNNSISDDDFGGGALLNDGSIVVNNKNGMLYALSGTNGALIWSHRTGVVDGYGGIGIPTTDGNTILVSAGYRNDPTKTTIPGGMFLGLNAQGAQRWSITTQNSVPGYAAIVNGLAFVDLDDTVNALSVSTGASLWSYTASNPFYASPAVVPSGVYAADKGGNVYAFSLSQVGATSTLKTVTRAHDRIDHDAIRQAIICNRK